jgi:DNA-binding SARP family transcriptional activator
MTSKIAAKKRLSARNEPREAHVFMFGRFELQIEGMTADETANRSTKMWALLAYLVMRRDRNIPQSEFIDLLWSDDNGNPGNALKTLLYRTRMTLAPILGDDIALILSKSGAYLWNPAITCVVDTEIFEALCRQAEDPALNDDQKMEIYREIVSIYKGDFLPKLSELLWVVTLSAHYHALYLNAVNAFAELLIERDLYAELNEVCTKALQIDAFDEQLHSYTVLSLLRQGNNAAALNHYEAATDLLYKNLGVKPSEKLRSLYFEIMSSGSLDIEMDIETILADLRATPDDSGVFFCDPGFFKLAYRLEARRAARRGASIHFALLTVSTKKGETPQLKLLNSTMSHLLDSIKTGLRKGDVVSRYSGSQYMLLLPTANFEDGQMAVDRILTIFSRKHPRSILKITSRLFQLDIE